MKKLKLLLLAMLGTVTAVSVSLAVACKPDEPEPHKHTYSTEWDHDDTYHWHNPTCTDTEEVSDKEQHTFGDGTVCTVCEYEKAAPTGKVYESLTLTTNNVKKDYYIGESFSSSGISATANYSDNSTSNVAERNLDIDSSKFDKTQVGVYQIEVSYTTGGVTHSSTYDVTVSSAEISVTGAKVEYFIGDEADNTGLTVTLNVTKPNATTVETSDVTSKASVGWSAVNFNVAGEYTVVVTYNLNIYTALTYPLTVTVLEVKEGLDVALAEGIATGAEISEDGFSATVTLGEGGRVTLNPSSVVVYKVDKYGVASDTALSSSDYTIEVYKNSELIENYEGLTGGTYQIWAKADSEVQQGFTLEAFVLVYVVDDLVSLTFDSEAEGTKLEQYTGADTISKTWKFTATYTSGVTKTIGIADLDNKTVDTATVGENRKFTASYTDTNALGASTKKSADVTYTIKALTGVIDYSIEYSVDAGNGSSVGTKWGAVQGADSHVSVTNNIGTFNPNEKSTADGSVTYTNYGEIKAADKQHVEFTIGSGLENVNITVYVSHGTKQGSVDSSNNNKPNDSRTAYITKGGTNTTSNLIRSATVVGVDGAAPANLYEMKVENATSGKYYVFTDGNTMRFYAVVITYQIDYDKVVETKTDKYTYSYSAIPVEGKTKNCDLTQADFTGANAFLTVPDCVYDGTNLVSGVKYRNKTNLDESAGDVIEIKGDAMIITFKGTGTIAITAKSTSGSNTSSIALKDSDGSYIAATYSGSTAGTTDVENVYKVTGTTEVVFTFTVNVAGTYTICSLSSLFDRMTRITGIVMTDTYVVE